MLANPLANYIGNNCPGWYVRSLVGAEANKSNLQQLLGGEETPAFLFTAGHGLVYPSMAEQQRQLQGSLLCADWPGPQVSEGVRLSQVFSSQDLADDAELGGLICFHYACYSAGTSGVRDLRSSAAKPFIARLAQRMLGHPEGGALAVIGQIESTWTSSILWRELREPQTRVFEDVVAALLQGRPVGAAMEAFGERYADLSVSLSRQLSHTGEKDEDQTYLANLWTACNDAQSYIVLGDPAVRLAVLPSE
jgi:hypothetical protein